MTSSILKPLDVEFIQEKLDEGYKYTEEAKHCDLVLVIGNTGVGKSTLCNYLLGYTMKEMSYDERTVVDTNVETPIKIGHEVKSETLYAKSFTLAIDDSSSSESLKCNSRICLLDCPGFYGNRSVEEQVIESVSIELAIRNAAQIKGILIVISIFDLLQSKVKELLDLVKILIIIFKDPVEMVLYSLFIITKKYKLMPDDEARKQTIGALTSLKKHCEKEAIRYHQNPNLNSPEGLTYFDYDKLKTYFSAVLAKIDDVMFVDPLDSGESKKIIMDRINDIPPRRSYFKTFVKASVELVKKAVGLENKPITIDDFNFSESNENRFKFNKALYDRAGEGHELIRKIRESSKIYIKLELEISNCHARLLTLKEFLSNLEEEICKMNEGKSQYSKVDFKSITTMETMITEKCKHIDAMKEEVNLIKDQKEDLKKKLEKIDVDDPLVFVEKSVNLDISWWKIFGWNEMKFKADTGNREVPIIDVDNGEMFNGNWIDEDDRREEGIYAITYQSIFRARPAIARVKTYIKTKHEPGNKIEIDSIKDNQHSLENQHTKLLSQITDLESKYETLISTVKQAKYDVKKYEDSLKQKLEECKKDQHHLNSQITKMQEKKKEVRFSGIESLKVFYKNQNKFDILVSLASFLQFPSILIYSFVEEYKTFLPTINSCRSTFEENANLDAAPSFQQEESVLRLKDPITGNEIKNLVVTAEGTVFDKHELLKQFDAANKDVPVLYTRENGSTEVIEYLGWNDVPEIQSFLNDRDTQISNILQQSSSWTSRFLEINNMGLEDLQELESEILKEIKTLKEHLERKELALNKVRLQLSRLCIGKQE